MVSSKKRLVESHPDVTSAQVNYDGRDVVLDLMADFEEDDRRARKHEDRVPREFVEFLEEHELNLKRAHFVSNQMGFDITVGQD